MEPGGGPPHAQQHHRSSMDARGTHGAAALGKTLLSVPRRPSDALHERAPQVVDLLEAHGAKNIRVFGSVARGTDGPDSDVDILCALPPEMGLEAFALADRLANLLGFPVDLVADSGTSTVLDGARAEAVPL